MSRSSHWLRNHLMVYWTVGGRRKKNHSVLALFVIYYQHPLLETHSQELDVLRRPDLSVFPKAKLNKVQKNSQEVQNSCFYKRSN